MKLFKPYNCVILAAIMLLSGSLVMAQDKEREKEMQEAMEAEKKAQMEDIMQARKMEMQEQQEKMRQLELQYAEQAERYERQGRDLERQYAPFVTGIAVPDGDFLIGSWGQENQSQLTLRKNFRGTTSTSKGEFDVDPNIHRFRCMITGSVRTGQIMIGVKYPDGKTFKELVINSSADINFSQSISITEGEEKKYSGTWTYVINAEEAEGNYMLQISTN
jgi:carboxylesterase type B